MLVLVLGPLVDLSIFFLVLVMTQVLVVLSHKRLVKVV